MRSTFTFFYIPKQKKTSKSGILEMLPSWYILSLKPKGKGDCKNLIHLSTGLNCQWLYLQVELDYFDDAFVYSCLCLFCFTHCLNLIVFTVRCSSCIVRKWSWKYRRLIFLNRLYINSAPTSVSGIMITDFSCSVAFVESLHWFLLSTFFI